MLGAQVVPEQRQINGLNLYSCKEASRKALYSASFIFLILEIAATTIIGVGGFVINLTIILAKEDGWQPLINLLLDIEKGHWELTSWKEILIFICLAINALQIISLFWIIPMTIVNAQCITRVGTRREQKHTILAICTLLFTGNLISGILLIIASAKTPNYKPGY